MASNFAYKNTRDFKFILKEWLPLEKVLAYDRYRENYSVEDVDMILDTILKMTKDLIEPGCDSADQFGVKFEDGKVLIAPSIPPIYKKLQQEGWCASNVDKSEGAVVLPQVIMFPLWEMFSAANPAFVPPFCVWVRVLPCWCRNSLPKMSRKNSWLRCGAAIIPEPCV